MMQVWRRRLTSRTTSSICIPPPPPPPPPDFSCRLLGICWSQCDRRGTGEESDPVSEHEDQNQPAGVGVGGGVGGGGREHAACRAKHGLASDTPSLHPPAVYVFALQGMRSFALPSTGPHSHQLEAKHPTLSCIASSSSARVSVRMSSRRPRENPTMLLYPRLRYSVPLGSC